MPALTYLAKPDASLMLSPLLDVGSRFESMLGYPMQAWLDDPHLMYSLIHPDDRDAIIALDEATNRSGEPFQSEYRLITADGREQWVRDESVLIRDDDGNPLYWLGFIVDISDLKRTEADLIEALAGQREANLELERVNRAKSEIVSMISHEFRTPLTSIQGFSELLEDDELAPEEVRGFAATINANARRLARMIHDMLDLDRLESGQTAMRREQVDLNQIASDVVELVGPTSPSHEFVLEFDPRLPTITGDVDLLVRVVMNLVGNAIKYSAPGTTVTITTQETEDSVTLQVKDEGIGIPESALETIFSRYTRIERIEQRHIEGTGLGLPIARQIVELHHGSVWAEIPPDGGSIFHVVLPKHSSSAAS
jgi:PAS domain S-box-containing protein